ncbi:hypothetical protein [Niveibacterium umoris]|uniref:Uncharacterized protein n=1 Tax=Niveibacterium umoris TaxID=1193620 RepID=A0A840BES0_9RHOO|nr:hypothetical protein [Niveibacterium umoris]MBB4011183.1 hypothetical protein [Niveibacterium umoris]
MSSTPGAAPGVLFCFGAADLQDSGASSEFVGRRGPYCHAPLQHCVGSLLLGACALSSGTASGVCLAAPNVLEAASGEFHRDLEKVLVFVAHCQLLEWFYCASRRDRSVKY